MRLDKFIEGLDEEQKLYIGSANAFMFIGTVKELRKMADRVDKFNKEQFVKSAEYAVRTLTADVQEKRRIQWITTKPERDKRFEYIINRFIFDAIKARETIDTAHENYKNYVPIMSRQVLDCYDRLQDGDEGGKVVIVTGNEEGKFWLESEFKLWVKGAETPEEGEDGEDAA